MRIPGVPYIQGRNDYTDSDDRKYGIAIHNTANDASAEDEASYATRRTDGISAHLYVDRDSVVQSLDTDDRAGHAGSTEGNNHAVAVEITGVNGWTRQQWLDRVAWSKLGAALAHVVREYGVAVRRASVTEMRNNPKVKAFYGHDDMRRAWGGTTHTDPGGNFPWDRLFQAVNAALGNSTKEEDDMFSDDDRALLKNLSALGFNGGPSCGTVVAPNNGRPPSGSLVQKLDELLERTGGDPVPVQVDASAVASALAANTEFIGALAKAVNDDHATRMRA